MATILVVDDVDENVEILQRMLHQLGYDVLAASDGHRALGLAEEKSPDVILLDVLMPEVDGIEVCRQLKRTAATRSIPVLLVSGLAHEEHIVRGLDAGAIDYITKPFNGTVLAARIRSALRGKEAYDAVEASARLRSEFLAVTSDELQTPLTSIIESTDSVLAPDRSDEERRAAIGSIRRTGDHLLRIVQDIRDLSELEAGRVEAELSECSPLEIVADVAALMHRQARSRDLQFNVEFVGPIPERMRTNPARLRQILFYLLGNAVKFTAGQAVGLRTQFLPASESGSVLQFEVTDSGAGLCGDVAERFEHETEIDPSTIRDLGASGFALAMCSHLTTVLRGRMSVVHVPGAGSRVRVMVPTGSLDGVALLERPSLATAVPAPGGAEHGGEIRLARCRVLFAEDDLVAQKTVSRGLTNAGASVTVAADGPSAIAVVLAAHASGRPFDVVVLEGHLTVMGGQHPAVFLRARGYRGPVVVLVDAEVRDGTDVGSCGDVIVKPFDVSTLITTIGGRRRTDDEPQAIAQPPGV